MTEFLFLSHLTQSNPLLSNLLSAIFKGYAFQCTWNRIKTACHGLQGANPIHSCAPLQPHHTILPFHMYLLLFFKNPKPFLCLSSSLSFSPSLLTGFSFIKFFEHHFNLLSFFETSEDSCGCIKT